MAKKTIITAALTGAWPKKENNPNVPMTPSEIADDMYACWKAGAAIAHIHMRDDEGNGTMDTAKFEETMKLFRERYPDCDIIVNMTTSGAIGATDELRVAHVKKLRPEMASYDCGTMNWMHASIFENSPKFLEMCGKLFQELEVKPEIEAFDPGMIANAAYYLKKGILKAPLHFQFCMGCANGIPGSVKNLVFMKETMDQLCPGSTWSTFGVGHAAMENMYAAVAMGGHIRVGMFDEFSMLNPGPLGEYVGFTEGEVQALCAKYQMDMEEIKNWYDGYSFKGVASVYSPRSVVSSMRLGEIGNYWNQTETFEALQIYIDMNFEGLRDDILSMIAGETVPVNTRSFTNDMTTFRNEDDVLTLLVHLGYLTYDYENRCVSIPNAEIREEYVNTVSVADWGEVSKALKNSADTLKAIWQMRPKQVAQGIKEAHFETSHLQYNDENALSYTISLALYAARNFYTMHRELAGGKGFADIVFIPRKKFPDKPAMVVELKWNKSAEGAISQIKNKEYCASLEEYKGDLLMVGINYNKKTREHTCIIEEYKK